MRLSGRQMLLIDEYMKDLNISAAGERAGYKSRPSSHQAFHNEKVQLELKRRQDKIKELNKVTADQLTEELKATAFCNIGDLYDLQTGRVKNLGEIALNKVGAITGIRTKLDKGGKTIISGYRVHDKMKAIDMLGKHIGYFEADNKQKATAVLSRDEMMKSLKELGLDY